jgi:hypothetical protein
MNLDQVRDTVIKPKLVESFGGLMASALIASSGNAMAGCKDDKEKLAAMVKALCSHDKVKAMWGEAMAQKRQKEWSSLLG